jgi:hypothetical protein
MNPPVSSFTLDQANNDYFIVSWTYENTGSSVFESFNIYGITKADYDATPNPEFDTLLTLLNESATNAVVPDPPTLLNGTEYVLRIIVYYSSGISTPVDITGTTRNS